MSGRKIFAVSGVKNSGKTTLIESLIPHFRRRGLSVAVIKHDGHDFEPDVPGTDSFRVRKAGAQSVAVFSGSRMMLIKESGDISEKELVRAFPESDLIILEGFKYSEYPKVEIIRRAVSKGPVCDPGSLIGAVTDFPAEELPEAYREVPLFFPDEEDTARLAEYLMRRLGLRKCSDWPYGAGK